MVKLRLPWGRSPDREMQKPPDEKSKILNYANYLIVSELTTYGWI